MIQFPPIRVTQGERLYRNFEWHEDGAPKDLTGWSGQFSILRWPSDRVREYPVQTAPGGVITIDVDDTRDFPIHRGYGPRVTALYEIHMTGPDGESKTFQGSLVVTRTLWTAPA